MTKVNIYYGGRGLIEDPTIYVTKKLTEVLDELNIEVKKYNLYEDKRGISMLPKTLKEADAIILAASVEWFGIGGLLQQFLDACWLYGDKDAIKKLYMMPVVLSTTYGEKDAYMTLVKSWEILGGIPCEGIKAYVENPVDFETNTKYGYLIEKCAENFYRTFSKKMITFPSSNNAVMKNVAKANTMSLTPQESEQLSVYVSDDTYVKQQKEDIAELAQMFKGLMGTGYEESNDEELLDKFQKHFYPIAGIALSFTIEITDRDTQFVLEIDDHNLNCYYGKKENANVLIRTSQSVLNKVLNAELTLQSAFMSGELTAKGDFKVLRNFDNLFQFRR